jgi:hypothetical protein
VRGLGPIGPFLSRLALPGLALALLAAVLATQLLWVRSTNFYGYDEWTVLFLLSRGIANIPYANRPLELLWALPAPHLAAHSFGVWSWLYALYALLSGWLVAMVCRRLAPGRPLLAFLAASFVVVWAPTDYARISQSERLLYGGITFGMLLAIVSYLESWERRSGALLLVSSCLAVVAALSYEATLPVLALAPLLLTFLHRRGTRSFVAWVVVWECVLAAALCRALWSLVFASGGPTYQSGFDLDLQPGRVAARLWRQLWLHVGPLCTSSPRELFVPAVPLAVMVFLGGLLVWRLRTRPRDLPGPSAALAGTGLLLAVAGYLSLAVSARGLAPWRMQFLSGPGVALLLAAAASGLAARAGRRATLVAALLGAWVVAVGTGRTLAMQRVVDVQSFYPVQRRMLAGLIEAAPELEPGSLVVLLDEVGAWRSGFGFHHAIEYLYRDQASGYVWGVWDGMFPMSFEPDGLHCEPWPSIRGPWSVAPVTYPYDRLVVVRFTPADGVRIAEDWPSELPPLPAGSRYAPLTRILALRAPFAERAVLR